MKIVNWFFLFILLSGFSVFSQEKYTQHTVSKGETISAIAKKYNVSAKSIYDLNPDSRNGIKLKETLLIPANLSNKVVIAEVSYTQSSIKTHDVQSKETVYSIAKSYNVSVKELYKSNPNLENEGLKKGQQINIPQAGNPKSSVTTNEIVTKITSKSEVSKEINSQDKKVSEKLSVPANTKVVEAASTKSSGTEYDVLPKDTKYSIAKVYGISVTQLEEANPSLQTEELKIGQKINIPQSSNKIDQVNATNKEVDIQKIEVTEKTSIQTKTKIAEASNAKSQEVSRVETRKNEAVIKTSETEKPNTGEATNEQSNGILYSIVAKDTKYSIAKAHGISIEQLDEANPSLQTDELKIGQKINIPVNGNSSNQIADVKTAIGNQEKQIPKKPVVHINSVEEDYTIEDTKGVEYIVLAKQTKYSIARECGITVAQLNKANPILLTKEMKVGQKIIIPIKRYNPNLDENSNKKEALVDVKLDDKNQEVVNANKEFNQISHEVLRKETKYGIAKEYGITVKELEEQNPDIKRRLTVGALLSIRSLKEIAPTVSVAENSIEEGIKNNNSKVVRDDSFIEQLIAAASENIGTPYRTGGTTKDGFDCSGLMCYAFSANDVKLPRSSIEMANYGVVVTPEEAKKGDLIFFKTRGGRQINHVGLVVDVADGDIKFIHSSNSGVMISSLKEKYYKKAFTQINHVL